MVRQQWATSIELSKKFAKTDHFTRLTVLTDRHELLFCAINNMGWWMTLEKALGIEIPKRVEYLRVIVMELARIADHIICNSVLAVDNWSLDRIFICIPVP